MSLEKITRKGVTHLTSFKLTKAPDDDTRHGIHPRRGFQHPIDIVDLGSAHIYKSLRILVKIRLGSITRDLVSLGGQIKQYAEWAHEQLPGIHEQCTELFTWIKVNSSLENTGLISDKLLNGVQELHEESAEVRTKLKRIIEALSLLKEMQAATKKLNTCENSLSEQENLQRANQIERLVDPLITPVQGGNLSQALLDANCCR